ncbi:hypothetical protein SFRURICE_003825 [Spodoptera frugiperda]|nr:hypothetical protein SFRURICE_003825 [Spodoptera frugiperda]
MSDGDSGEEDCDSINRLNRHQLLAPAEMVLRQREEHDEENRTIDEVLVSPSTSSQYLETLTPAAGPSSNRSRRSRHVETRADGTSSERSQQRQRIVRPRKWVKRDLRYQQCEWSPPLPRAVLTLTKESEPIEFFELFFSEDVISAVRSALVYGRVYKTRESRGTSRCLPNYEYTQPLIANELLAFIQHAIDTMDEVSILQICKSNFKEEDISSGKKLLFQCLGKLDEMPARRRDGTEKSVQDIITLLKVTDPDDVPAFVAKDLHKLPPVTFDHVDVTRLLKDIISLKTSLAEVQSKLMSSENTIGELRAGIIGITQHCRCKWVTNTVHRRRKHMPRCS